MGRADVERLASHHAPPTEWGKKPSPRCGHVREETGQLQDAVIVAVVVVVVAVVAGVAVAVVLVVVAVVAAGVVASGVGVCVVCC